MPRRAQPGNRERIEAALGPALRSALAALCSTLGVPRSSWQRVPALQFTFTTAAVVRLAASLREDGGRGGERAAIETAALRLGVPPDTILARIRSLDV